MATGITQGTANTALAAVSSYAIFISLHQGDPATTGANEISLSSYSRFPASWQAPTSGQLKLIAAGVPVAVPGVCSISHFGFWTQKSLGAYGGNGSFTTCEVFVNPGTFTVQSLTYSLPII